MYTVNITPTAIGDLHYLRKFDQKKIVANIKDQLTYHPTVPTNDRKLLRPNNTSQWELRVEDFRVMYDVDEDNKIVEIKTIGYKPRNQLYVRGREYNL